MPLKEEVVIRDDYSWLYSPATHEVIVDGPRGAEPLTVLLGIVAQLLIKCCSCTSQLNMLAAAGSLRIRCQRWWAPARGGD